MVAIFKDALFMFLTRSGYNSPMLRCQYVLAFFTADIVDMDQLAGLLAVYFYLVANVVDPYRCLSPSFHPIGS